MNTFLNYLSEASSYVPYVVTAAAAAAAALPAPREGTKWAAVRKVVDFLALNVFNAKITPKP